jgi:CBS domain containing-hemolysin-like protein
MSEVLLQGGFLILLIALSGFFSGSETAFFSLDPLKVAQLRRERSRTSSAVVRQLDQPRRLLVTILVGNMVANILASSIAAGTLWRIFGDQGIVIATIAMMMVILLFGEVVPKTFAVHNAEFLAKQAAFPLAFFSRVIWPIREVLRWLTVLLLSSSSSSRKGVSKDELRTVVEVGHGEGVLERFEKDIIHNILDLDAQQIRGVMTPRTELFTLEEGCPVEEARAKLKERGYSRVPVWRDAAGNEASSENIVGFVHIRDLLIARGGTLVSCTRPLRFVPETKRIGDLLQDFIEQGEHLAIVIDEYGDLAGLVTLEDLLERVVGWIADRSRQPRRMARRVAAGRFRLSARTELERFNELLGTAIIDEEAETIGGVILNRLGRIPAQGEHLSLDGVNVYIVKAAPHRILEIEIQKAR